LRASEARFRQLVDESPNAMLMMDGAGNITLVNRQLETMFGYADTELLGRTVEILVPERFRDNHPSLRARFLADPSPRAMGVGRDVYGRRNDGTEFPIEIVLSPLTTANGVLPLAIITDITDRKRAEEALRANEKQLNEAQRIAGIGSWELDLENSVLTWSDESFRIFELNPERFGASYEAFLNAIHPEDREMVNASYTNSVKTRQSYEMVHRLLMADGRVKFVHERCETIYDDAGRPLRSIGTVQDVSDRKQSEEQMALLRRQLAHASRLGTLGEMSAGLAHELNQPLAALRLYATAAKDLGATTNSQELLDCLTRIDEQSLRAGEIVRRMRSFVGRHPFRRETADLHELLREVLAILENELRHSRVITKLDLDDSLPLVSVDRIQIQQILVNLIRNAIEAMTQPGCGSRHLSISTSNDGSTVRFNIADTGDGLAPPIASRLFEPFQSTKPTGLGLGLAICRTLVEAHGGSIGAQPNPTQGTTFFFSLPAIPGQAAS
jgi:PAS domain S-box-containing protein